MTHIRFKEDKADEELCSQTLNTRDLGKLRRAIARDYYFQVGVEASAPGVPGQVTRGQLLIVGVVGADY